MKRATRKSLCAVLTAALLISGVAMPGVAEAKKAKVKISKKKLTLTVGQKKKLTVKGTKKKVKWSTSNKKVATVTKKGVVKAKKKGTAKITAKVGKKKYKCTVKVKAKTNGATATSKPTANTGSTPGGGTSGSSTSSPGGSTPGGSGTSGGNTSSPKPTASPGGNTSEGGDPSPSIPPDAEGTPVPVVTPEPSEDDSVKADVYLTLNTALDDSKGKTWDYYHKNLGRVPAEVGDTLTVDYRNIDDGRIDYKNTYGEALTIDELKAHEDEDWGEGEFWDHHARREGTIELEPGKNTIYIRMRVYDVRDNVIDVQYINTDIIVAKYPPQEDPTPTPTPTGGGSGGGGTTPPDATGSRGQDVAIDSWRNTFTVSSGAHDYKLALGMSAEDVETVLGDYSLDVHRKDIKSPQGFDVIAFREDGNDTSKDYDDRYKTYILVYLQWGYVVSITAIAPNISCGDYNAGDLSLSKLQSGGWTASSWYTTTGGSSGAYYTDSKDGQVVAYIDYYGNQNTYCMQLNSSSTGLDQIADMSKTNLQLSYSSDVLEEMALESGELINAYLVNTGASALRINSTLSTVAQSYSKQIADSQETNAAYASRGNTEVKSDMINKGYGEPSAWGEYISIGNMDAIGFANTAIESSTGRTYIRDQDHISMGLGANAYNDGSHDYPNLVIDFASLPK